MQNVTLKPTPPSAGHCFIGLRRNVVVDALAVWVIEWTILAIWFVR